MKFWQKNLETKNSGAKNSATWNSGTWADCEAGVALTRTFVEHGWIFSGSVGKIQGNLSAREYWLYIYCIFRKIIGQNTK